jgi:hypothetical protein
MRISLASWLRTSERASAYIAHLEPTLEFSYEGGKTVSLIEVRMVQVVEEISGQSGFQRGPSFSGERHGHLVPTPWLVAYQR